MGLVLIAVSAIAIQAVAYYFYQNMSNHEASKSAVLCRGIDASCIRVSTLINYGNTSIVWHNVSDVPSAWNFYQLTVHIANVDSTSFSFGHLVTSIDGVHASGSSYWRLWIFCGSKSAWFYSAVGADSLSLTDGSSFAWALQSDPSQPPISGEATVDSC